MSLLSIDKLNCQRGEKTIIKQLNFQLNSGEVLLIQGANGTGKTTLIKTLSTLLPSSHGKIYFNNEDIQQDKLKYREQILYIGHHAGLWLDLTVLENLELICELYQAAPKLIPKALEQFQLTKKQHKPLRQLSAGQRRRTALCRLILQRAPLWLLDEPFTALDQTGVNLLKDLMIQHAKNDGAVLLSSHQAFSLDNINFKILDLHQACA